MPKHENDYHAFGKLGMTACGKRVNTYLRVARNLRHVTCEECIKKIPASLLAAASENSIVK